jgi:hypothetical protein
VPELRVLVISAYDAIGDGGGIQASGVGVTPSNDGGSSGPPELTADRRSS